MIQRYMIPIIFGFALILSLGAAQSTCQCRAPEGSCAVISSNGDGTCETTVQPCTTCVCDATGPFVCDIQAREVLQFNASSGGLCSLTTVQNAECPAETPPPSTIERSACCWSWTDDDIFNNECALVGPSFSPSSITYGIANMSQTYTTTYQGDSQQTSFTQTVRYNLGGSQVNIFNQVMGTLAGNRIYEQTGTESFIPNADAQSYTYTTTTADPRTAAITVSAASTGTRLQAFNFLSGPNPTQTMNNQLTLTQTLFLLKNITSSTSTCLYVEWTP